MPEPDYPAAHSMDTTWFAVDADGHVAVFESGEEGAVPLEACTDDDTSLEELRKSTPETPMSLGDWTGDEGGEVHRELPEPPRPRRRRKGAHQGEPSSLGTTLMFLDSLDRVRAELEDWGVSYAPATEGVAVVFHDLPVETALRLHQAGACLGCFPWDGSPFIGLDAGLAERLGIFRYSHNDYDFAVAPYLRSESVPARPLRLEDLPGPLRESIGRLRLATVRFAETPLLQPAAHFSCGTWGRFAYLDVDGVTVRPLPGSEQEYRDAYARLVAAWPDLRFEPPPPE